MPSWNDILIEIKKSGNTSIYDIIRRKYINKLYQKTGRNIIIYYSGWLQKPNSPGTEVNDNDKNGFMAVINKMDKEKGLDLILHTPGGEVAATESLIDYIHSIFGNNIRAIIPQLAMSAGTMIACACKEIVMGKQSSLGPVDPQFGNTSAHGIIEEFQRAYDEIKQDQAKIAIWQPILAKYPPAFVGKCEKAMTWAKIIVKNSLKNGMFSEKKVAEKKIDEIILMLTNNSFTKSHSRHLSAKMCENIGLKIVYLEADQDLQDKILSIHHACIHTLSATTSIKIIENQNDTAFIQHANISKKI